MTQLIRWEAVRMVMLTPDDAKKYPIYTEFVLATLPKVASDDKVFNALLDCAGIERGGGNRIPAGAAKGVARMATMRGLLPWIVPWFNSDIARWAEFRPAEPHRLYVNLYWIVEFEKSPNHFKPAPQHFVVATVLHELVHYLDFMDGQLQDAEIIEGKLKWIEGKEQGHEFELRAFGGTKNFAGVVVQKGP